MADASAASAVAVAPHRMETRSYCNDDGGNKDWRFRKISFFGVVRSFVSQLKPGQDLTRVALPAILLHPFSILEQVGNRIMGYYDTVLLDIAKQDDPVDRILTVCKYYACCYQKEDMHKKPYNPILGEVHKCSTTSAQHGETFFFGEQVSHHPPISAMFVHNKTAGVSLKGTVSFRVKFGNTVQINTDGWTEIVVDKYRETYKLPRNSPEIMIKNVIVPGKKYIYWVDEFTIECEETGLTATMAFGEQSGKNILKGSVFKTGESEPFVTFTGECGGQLTAVRVASGSEDTLIHVGTTPASQIIYPTLTELRATDPMESRVVWHETNEYIVDNVMDKADIVKKEVEQSQRDRLNAVRDDAGELPPFVGKFFEATADSFDLRAEFLETVTHNGKDSGAGAGDARSNRRKTTSTRANVTSSDSISDDDHPSSPTAISRKHAEEDRETLARSWDVIDESLSESSESDEGSIDSGEGKPTQSDRKKSSKTKGSSKKATSARVSTSAAVEPAADLLAAMSRLPRNTVLQKGWVKMRNTMKVWITRWIALQPGRLVYYKDDKDMLFDRAAGIIQLADCRIKERHTDKDGVSFKIYHLLRYPIYQKFDLQGKRIRSASIPLSSSYAIIRVASLQEQKYWMSAIAEQIAYATAVGTTKPAVTREFLPNSDVEDSNDERESSSGKKSRRARKSANEDTPNQLVRSELRKYSSNARKRATGIGESAAENALGEWRQQFDSRLNGMLTKITQGVSLRESDSRLIRVKRSELVLFLLCVFLLGFCL